MPKPTVNLFRARFARASFVRTWLVLGVVCCTPIAHAATATYQVRFEADWSATTHQGAFTTNNPHFSTLIGASHGHSVRVWQPGTLASPGIKVMAETGGTSMLINEMQSLITAGQASSIFTGAGPGSPGQSTINSITIDEAFPDVSLVTMIAPSPDWFIGVHNLPMIAEGSWRQSIAMSLQAYDAGTDSGTTFTAPDLESVPHVAIALVQDVPLNNAPIGRFIFTLISSSGTPDRLFADGMETF
jgi:hypothetical protein